MCTTTRRVVGGSCPGQCSWIWSRAPWTASDWDRTTRLSYPTISFLGSRVRPTTGPKVTTLRGRS
uniref:Uncharacterized protein n=1 Tax=Vitis vinifera TaxID=29760 RepID=F6H6N4_VITVI